MKKIIHITIDEKFINSAYEQFNELGDTNQFYILSRSKNTEFKYINYKSNIFSLKPNKKNLKQFASEINNSIIIFHGLGLYASIIAHYLKPNQNNKLIWFLWGSEFYFNTSIYKTGKLFFLGSKSKELELKIQNTKIKDWLKDIFKIKILQTYYLISSKSAFIKSAMTKMDALGILYPEEHSLITQKIHTKTKYIKFTYYPLEIMINDLSSEVIGNNVLIGNSASSSNNHLEAFDLLNTFDLKDRKILCPLSYGDKEYAKVIASTGKRIFKDNFIPLMDFMPLEEYNKTIQSCAIVIMNHYRQQAVGNIIVMIYLGSKVYLDERSTVYEFAKNLGLNIYSISTDLNNQNKTALEGLTVEQKLHNKVILKKYMSKKELMQSLEQGLKELNQK